MFPLDNLTRVSMASFSEVYFYLVGFGGPGKDCNVRVVP